MLDALMALTTGAIIAVFVIFLMKKGLFEKDKNAERMQDGADYATRVMADLVVDGIAEKLQTIAAPHHMIVLYP